MTLTTKYQKVHFDKSMIYDNFPSNHSTPCHNNHGNFICCFKKMYVYIYGNFPP